jgi:hypothetical protein
MKLLNIIKFAMFFLMFCMFTSCTNGQPRVNLNGIWHSSESSHDENLGYYTYYETLEVSGDNYTFYTERISEYAIHWQYGTRGKIIVTQNEIKLFPREGIRQMSDWEPVVENEDSYQYEKEIFYKYVLNGDDLILMSDGYTEVLRKQSYAYSGTMSGSQTLNIKLVIGGITTSGEVLDSFYMYYKNGKYGDQIKLVGHLEDDTLTLYEKEPNNVNRASMQFPNFDISSVEITGVWQDLRTGKFSNRYELKLSK